MLKGFPLSKMAAEPQQRTAFKTRKVRTRALRDLGEGEDADAVKAYLRSQYASIVRTARSLHAHALQDMAVGLPGD